MKARRTVKMPLKRPPTRGRPATPKLRARAAEDDQDIEDYEGEAEPNMRFSHALFVVLILHVIAVAGVFAFNSIKAKQVSQPTATLEGPLPTAPSKPEADASLVKQEAASPKNADGTHTVVAGETLGKIAAQYKTTVEALEQANGITSRSLIRVGQVLTVKPSASPAKA
ncbi:MAG: LysM peptidoglycan-binding domain-containing protein, partial [Terrimicrobiaceae bacterium]